MGGESMEIRIEQAARDYIAAKSKDRAITIETALRPGGC